MGPEQLSNGLRRLAASIESAKRPSRSKVVGHLRKLIVAMNGDGDEEEWTDPVEAARYLVQNSPDLMLVIDQFKDAASGVQWVLEDLEWMYPGWTQEDYAKALEEMKKLTFG